MSKPGTFDKLARCGCVVKHDDDDLIWHWSKCPSIARRDAELAEARKRIAVLEKFTFDAGVAMGQESKRLAEAKREIERLREAIQKVLDDTESKDGGWGPDVTTRFVLEAALAPPATTQEPHDE